MTEQHPIMPPDELVRQWRNSKIFLKDALMVAAQWGADQELEACVGWLARIGYFDSAHDLRAARRPKPPSLKEQALNGLEKVGGFTLCQLRGVSDFDEYKTYVDNIRQALEQLDD